MPRSRLLIAAIHNGELPNAPAQVLINQLLDLATQVIEEVQQPALDSVPDKSALESWRRRQSELETDWSRYLEHPTPTVQKIVGRVLFDLKINLSSQAREHAWLIRQVERAVTAKHIRAWRQFQDSGNQELLVVESDATTTDASHPVIAQLLTLPALDARYINLAGGLDLHQIKVTHLADNKDSDFGGLRRFRKPVSNTSCAYLVNQVFIAMALRHLDSYPQDAELGIDWLFNAIFLNNSGEPIECLHADPPAIVHGSTQGVTSSWHPER